MCWQCDLLAAPVGRYELPVALPAAPPTLVARVERLESIIAQLIGEDQ